MFLSVNFLFILLYFIQQFINGLAVGSTYALVAVGYTLVYGIIGLINFAHGEIYMISTYVVLIVLALCSVWLDPWWGIVCTLLVTALVMGTYGYSLERIAYRPLRTNKNKLVALITAIGMSIFLQNIVRLMHSSRDLGIPKVVEGNFQWQGEHFDLTISYTQVMIIVVTFLVMVATWSVFRFTRFGLAARATAGNSEMCSLLGVNVQRTISGVFVLGAILAAVAGLLLSIHFGATNPYVGFVAGVKAFAAAVLGGIGSLPGALLGGLIIGVAEALTGSYISMEYKDVVSFLLLVLVLMFYPSGLLGRAEVEKI